jgi:hypothetical protein
MKYPRLSEIADALTQTEEQLRTFEVILLQGRKIAARGKGENALGSPLLALRHLGDVLANQP